MWLYKDTHLVNFLNVSCFHLSLKDSWDKDETLSLDFVQKNESVFCKNNCKYPKTTVLIGRNCFLVLLPYYVILDTVIHIINQ